MVLLIGTKHLSAQTGDEFITTWETSTANETITIPTLSTEVYSYTIDWGDGSALQTTVTGDATHTYTNAGVHTVKISGTFPAIYFNDEGDAEKIRAIIQWGNIAWATMENAFSGCSNLSLSATDAPDLSMVTSLSSMFSGAKFLDADLNHWNVSTITNMSFMFENCMAFNGNISNWNVNSVTNMKGTFRHCWAFNNDISSWNVSNVNTMESMFRFAKVFDRDISGWDVSSVTVFAEMFRDALAFNQDIGGWDMRKAEDISRMLQRTTAFDQDISQWDIGAVTTAFRMLQVSNLSVANYDRLLAGWSTDDSGIAGDGIDDIPTNITFGADGVTYCSGGMNRAKLMSTFDWEITDTGIDSDCGVVLDAKVYLQGASVDPFMGEEDLMRDELRALGYISHTSPYDDGFVLDAAAVLDTGGTSGTGNPQNDIVDWVWIALRDVVDNTKTIVWRSALLQRDGNIVETDGISSLSINALPGSYHVEVGHRNHLSVLSTSPVNLDDGVTSLDFSDGSISTYGDHAQTNAGMPVGILGLWAGDVNSDGEIVFLNTGAESVDIKQLVLERSAEESPFGASVFYKPQGYYDADVNMDGEVIFLNAGNELLAIKDNILVHPLNQIFNSVFYKIQQQLP